VLFTGDHVMQGSTVVINPPDGHMGSYLLSLQRVAEEVGTSYDLIAPGHGFLIGQPALALQHLIAHRRRSESRVCEVLAAVGPVTVDTLLPHVYVDVPPERHPVARRSLLAHLLHLHEQGRAIRAADDLWTTKEVKA